MSPRLKSISSLSAAGNETRSRGTDFDRDPGGPHISATTISFTAPDTIGDSGNGFLFAAGNVIEIAGSPANSGRMAVVTASAGTLTVPSGRITSESAGAVIDIDRAE